MLALGLSLISTKTVFAENTNENHMANLVDKIATKFGLEKDDVQAVVDEDRNEYEAKMKESREERQAEMEALFEESLNKEVADGKITQEQKTLILEKRKELHTNRQDAVKSTHQERINARESEHNELVGWATSNGIDVKYLMDEIGMPRHGFQNGGKPEI